MRRILALLLLVGCGGATGLDSPARDDAGAPCWISYDDGLTRIYAECPDAAPVAP